MNGQVPDFSKIMKLAQEVASKIEPPEGLANNGQLSSDDMSAVLGQITKSVGEIVTPEMLATQFNPTQPVNKGKNKKKNGGQSKISFSSSNLEDITDEKKEECKTEECKTEECCSKTEGRKSDRKKSRRYVEIESTDEETDDDPTVPRTKDMTFTLSVTLEELFTGTKKKLGFRRQKIDTDGSYEEEKKKLSIKIEPGMIEDQVIRFNHMADEKQGYETGDVVVTLDVEEHGEFTRLGHDLIIEREISFSEAYSPVVYFKHLNSKYYKVTGPAIDVFNNMEEDLMKKIEGLGMPVAGEPGEYGDLFIKFTCVNKTKITSEILDTLRTIFPPIVKPLVVEENETIIETEFETVTESDLEYLESDSDSDSEFDSDDSETDSDEETNDEESDNEEVLEKQKEDVSKKTKEDKVDAD